jgi:hypothetical protein
LGGRLKTAIISSIRIDARLEVFTGVKIQAEVFWVVIPYSVAGGYQLHLHPEDGGRKVL